MILIFSMPTSDFIRFIQMILFLYSAFFGVIGASVYTSFASQLYSSSGFVYGHGYIFAWISVGLLFIANPCNYFSARKMSENCQV